jgi:hypothetical protein
LPQRRRCRLRYPHGEGIFAGGSGSRVNAAFLQNAGLGRGGTHSVALGSCLSMGRWSGGLMAMLLGPGIHREAGKWER